MNNVNNEMAETTIKRGGETMKMILLILMTVSCLACNTPQVLMFGLGGFVGGSIILNVVSEDDKVKCDVCGKYDLGKADKDGSYVCKTCKQLSEKK